MKKIRKKNSGGMIHGQRDVFCIGGAVGVSSRKLMLLPARPLLKIAYFWAFFEEGTK